MSKVHFHAAMAAAAVLLFGSPARANSSYVTNGSFESTTNGNGQMGFNTDATDWTTTGYNFLFASGTGDVDGDTTGQFGSLSLWGPNNGSNNGLPASSPDGGNYIAADGAFEIAPVQQTIDGLTAGNLYVLGFWWAGAQQSGFDGVTTDQWQVSLGSDTQSTAIVTNVDQGFSGWTYQTFTFIADNTSDVLSFLAVGTPAGEPPFSLLDGVTLSDAPEPATFALLGLGLLAIPAASRLRRKRS